MSSVPAARLRSLNRGDINSAGEYILYWMTSARRVKYNYGLQRAAEVARGLGRPLVVLEALRVAYPWASRRLHAFVIQGMADNLRAMGDSQAFYYPYLEPAPGAGKGLLASLAQKACTVIADEFPCFFFPRMLEAAAHQVAVRMEAVDSCGLLPMASTPHPFHRALDLRRFLQRNLAGHLEAFPQARPLSPGPPPTPRLPASVFRRWPPVSAEELTRPAALLERLPIGQGVSTVSLLGGSGAASARLREFVSQRLAGYADQKRRPPEQVGSGLSPYLHFGHISPHEVFIRVAEHEGWAPHLLNPNARGARQGFWGMSAGAEAFLDQLITWRELNYIFCHHRPDYDRYQSLPAWAQATLEQHASDPRPYVYRAQELMSAATHDPVWNAAQRQLLTQGTVANYLRMLWGKKILEWSPDPRQALEVMIEMNNLLALDGRDPNSYGGIFWCLGRFDRPWGPERPIFGKVRYMSSANTLVKLKLNSYLERFGPSCL